MRGNYFTLDDATVLAAATADPVGFLRRQDGMTVIDEVQKAPGLFPAIKRQVDRDRKPGRFLLTGSANVLLLPKISESLAGRIEIVTLWPFSQGELAGRQERFIDAVFSADMPRMIKARPADRDIVKCVLTGEYPEAVARTVPERRQAWFGAYITTILQRDVRDLAHIVGLTDMPRLLSLMAARSGGLLNMSEISRSTGLAHTTLRRYLSLLETTFLVQPLPAWSTNRGKRLVKSPKLHLVDSGMAAQLSGVMNREHPGDRQFYGHLLETFVVMELRKQMTWNKTRCSLFYFRTSSGQEVDAVLEDIQGRIVGIE
ncbi:MAG: ATP-binding protein, partial [Nitrospirae bacterium]|nr:ATP-binding protein [Nitrospirota bacterium]